MSSFTIGARAAELLTDHGLSWLDASGNYHLRLPNAVIERSGQRTRGRSPKPRRQIFAKRASRIVRVLLAFPDKEWGTGELAHKVLIDPGHASRTLQTLLDSGYVSHDGRWHLERPDDLLADWAEAYRFDRHDTKSFFSLKPQVEHRMASLASLAEALGLQVAFTGAPAAGLWGVRSAVDQVVAYVETPEARNALAQDAALSPEVEAPNTLITVLEDTGVFIPTEPRGNLPLVCRPQIYLDVRWAPRSGSLAPEMLKVEPWRS